jgi:hypothetical protein
MRKFLKTARRRLSESRMRENLMSGSMWQGMETRQGYDIEALSQETERQQAIEPKSRRHPLTLPTYREKRDKGYQGYVANLSETCDPKNPLQLITKVQTAPNATDDSQLLAEALPDLKQRTALKTIYTDGGHGGPASDAVLQEQQVEHIQTAIRGRIPNPEKLHLADFTIQTNSP